MIWTRKLEKKTKNIHNDKINSPCEEVTFVSCLDRNIHGTSTFRRIVLCSQRTRHLYPSVAGHVLLKFIWDVENWSWVTWSKTSCHGRTGISAAGVSGTTYIGLIPLSLGTTHAIRFSQNAFPESAAILDVLHCIWFQHRKFTFFYKKRKRVLFTYACVRYFFISAQYFINIFRIFKKSCIILSIWLQFKSKQHIMKWSWMLRRLYLWRSWLALLVYRSMHLGPSTAHKDSFLWPSGSLPLPQSNTGQTWSSPLGGGWSLHRFSYHSYRKCLEGKWQCHIGTSRIIGIYTCTDFFFVNTGSYLM